MPAPQKKRDIADFFKPHARTIVPQKRPSPSSTHSDRGAPEQRPAPKTPVRSVTFKDVTPVSVVPSCSPVSQKSLPIRSPQRGKITNSATKVKQSSLFEKFEESFEENASTKPSNNTSFTFSDISDRSQKIIQDGKVVGIRDSDDDTDSLESLEDIFAKKKDAVATSDSSPVQDVEAERIKTLGMFTFGRSAPIVGKDKLRALHAKEKAVKFDLSVLLDDHFGDEEAEQNISRMRAGFTDAQDQQQTSQLDKDLLASVVRGEDADAEDVDRLLNAVERTEALSSEKVFSFFDSRTVSKSGTRPLEPFPKQAIPHELWLSKDTHARDRTYMSGYMAELAEGGYLSDKALRWTFDRILSEPRLELRHAYVQCLRACSKAWTRLNVTAADVQAVFQQLDADPDCLRDSSSIVAKHHTVRPRPQQHHDFLRSILSMFRVICADMDFPALSKLCSIVMRIVLDNLAMSNTRVCVAAEDLVEALLSLPNEAARNHVYERFLSDATEHLTDPRLQVQLLNHLLPTTDDLIMLRETLADVFLLGPKIIDPNTNTSNAKLDDLTTLLSTNPSFSTTRHANSTAVDYTALTSLTQILDIAVSSGTPPPFPISPGRNLSKPTPSEIEFNAQIDRLADKVHALFVSIKDTGASHMRRTEAKDALQALYFRLLFSVRTQARRKKHVFDPNGNPRANTAGGSGTGSGRWVTGEEWRERERGGDFMKQFLARTRRVAGPAGDVVAAPD